MKAEAAASHLFTNIRPTAYGYRRHAEDEYSYMNSHADAPVATARGWLESWYSRYPIAHREDLARRFRQRNNKQHMGAFWELYMHELFLRMGYEVEVHASTPGASSRPDFLLKREGVPAAIVEARLAGVESDEVTAANNLKAELEDTLNLVNSPNFFLCINEISSAPKRPSFKHLVKAIETWLANLSPDLPDEVYMRERRGSLQFKWKEDGWALSLSVLPKSQQSRGKQGIRSVGIFGGGEARWLDTRGELKRALNDKATKYGQTGLPYIIAINHLGIHCGKSDWQDALFGTSATTISFAKNGTPFQKPFRKNDGFWVNKGEPRHTNVSAVIAGWAISPWTMGAHPLEVYEHFDPAHPFDFQGNLPVWQVSEVTGELTLQNGRSNAELFHVPSGWPGTWGSAESPS